MENKGSGDEGARSAATDLDDTKADLEKLREILFGAVRREFEKRLAALDEQHETDISNLQAEIKSAIEPIERYAREEVEALNERLRQQESLRSAAIRASEERAGERLEELRSHLEERAKLLSDEMRRKEDALAAAMKKAIREIDMRKVDRTALAGLLAQTAMNVGREERPMSSEEEEGSPRRHH